MPIIANGVTIPTNGNFTVANGTVVDVVVANGVEVWRRITETVAVNMPNYSSGYFTSGGVVTLYPVNLNFDFTNYKTIKLSYDLTYSGAARGPYDSMRFRYGNHYVDIFADTWGSTTNTKYSATHTYDVSGYTGSQPIELRLQINSLQVGVHIEGAIKIALMQ